MRKVAEDRLDVFEPWTDSTNLREPALDAGPPVSATAFLREEAVPEIAEAARRVQAVDHQLLLQDLLDLPDAALRVLFWPHPGRMALGPERTRVTLEFSVPRGEPDVVARWWPGDRPSVRYPLGRISAEVLDLEWIRSRVLDVIEAGLEEA